MYQCEQIWINSPVLAKFCVLKKQFSLLWLEPRAAGADESTELFLPPIVWNRTEKVIQVERVVGKKYWERQRESLKKKEWERWRKKNRDECEKDREMEKERKKEREKWERERDRKREVRKTDR